MQEVFEKIREKLEETKTKKYVSGITSNAYEFGACHALDDAIEIVNQVEEEYQAKSEDVSNKLLSGEWVDTEDIEKYLGIGFSLGMKLFDFSRKAEWNPPPLNGQKITTEFRLKRKNNNGWIPVEERCPDSDRLVLLSFYNYPVPAIGRYIGDEDNGGAFYTDESDKPLCAIGFIVNAWMELPERYKED